VRGNGVFCFFLVGISFRGNSLFVRSHHGRCILVGWSSDGDGVEKIEDA